jgi:hypothetical protein
MPISGNISSKSGQFGAFLPQKSFKSFKKLLPSDLNFLNRKTMGESA